MAIRTIIPEEANRKDLHQFMLGGIVPRPIALVSTQDNRGIRNLAPFSYFNAVSSLPPVLMVSVGRKEDGSKKDTLRNVESNGEFVVNMVRFDMIRQMALSAVEFPPETDEFDMTGFVAEPSLLVGPPRVSGSPVQFECRLRKILSLEKGSLESSLIFGDVICIHVDESIIGENQRIRPEKMDVVGRLGRSHYARIVPESIHTVVQAQRSSPIGYSALPDHIRHSIILTANEIARLAACTEIPDPDLMENSLKQHGLDARSDDRLIHEKIRELIRGDKLELALQLAFLKT